MSIMKMVTKLKTIQLNKVKLMFHSHNQNLLEKCILNLVVAREF